MIEDNDVKELRRRVPDSWYVDQIEVINRLAAALPFERFREPVAIMELADSGHNQLINLNAEYLVGWTRHIAYSMRVRLRSLEPAIVHELAAGHALAPQVLMRTHLESSAMAALCLETLMESTPDKLSKLVPRTLLGTALFNKAKRDEQIAELLAYSEQRTIVISDAINALDRFAYPEGGSTKTSVVYALLCEASHPNHRGTHLFRTTEEVDPNVEYGWFIDYSGNEDVPPELTERLVETLLFSMSCGYAATELLRNIDVTDAPDGYKVHGVPDEVGTRIWSAFVQTTIRDAPGEKKPVT